MWLGGEPQYIDGRAKAIPEVGTPSVEWSGVASLYQQHRKTEPAGPGRAQDCRQQQQQQQQQQPPQ